MRTILVGATALCTGCFSPEDPRVTGTIGTVDTSGAPTSDPTTSDPTTTGATDPTTTDATDPTTTDPTTDPTTTDATTTDADTTAAESSSTGLPDPVCGNGVPEGDEPCDDGNDVDTDECTNACALPACGDGIVSGVEVCDDGNGVDDDLCDNACASTLRPNLLLCGDSTQDIATFIPDGAVLTVVASCTPDASTQAMVISRNGTIDAPTLQAYVAGGGIVLTEVFISDAVFNAVFGTAVVEDGFFGSCTDIAPTVEQFSLGDPFWAANAFQAITLEQSGCGSNVINYPGLVPLAGWAPGQVSIGYRDDGAGRVWMTEFDWSDGEINDPYTEQLMGSMIVTDG
ncbi:MAG: DUF4215 domain-containing protein [Myxococcales bacterium]|nr:DUF4215 domain-containing protein [Myxococcales bacterium]